MVKKITRPRVYARLRPMFGRDAGQLELFSATDTALEYRKDPNAPLSKYEFDRVFGMDARQEDVYESIGDMALTSLRQGFNSTILAYGQTGSGKTFSMEGARDKSGHYVSKGLIPRIFENVFAMFEADVAKGECKSFEVSIQFVELYNEQLQDLQSMYSRTHVLMYSCTHVLVYSCTHVLMYSCLTHTLVHSCKHAIVQPYHHRVSMPSCTAGRTCSESGKWLRSNRIPAADTAHRTQ
jgi:hypothetical protein